MFLSLFIYFILKLYLPLPGNSAILGGTILASLFLGPFIICACCYCIWKQRGKKQTNFQSEQIQNAQEAAPGLTNTESSLPPPPSGYNLVPLSDISQPQVPPGFKLIPLSELQQPQPPPGYNFVPLAEIK